MGGRLSYRIKRRDEIGQTACQPAVFVINATATPPNMQWDAPEAHPIQIEGSTLGD